MIVRWRGDQAEFAVPEIIDPNYHQKGMKIGGRVLCTETMHAHGEEQ